jgi:hypothetical protein
MCQVAIAQRPIKARVLVEFGDAIRKLVAPFVDEGRYLEDHKDTGKSEAYPDISTYFLFFR